MRYIAIILSLFLLGCISAVQEAEEETDNVTEPPEEEVVPEETVEEEPPVEEPAEEPVEEPAAETCSDSDGKDEYAEGTTEAFGTTFKDTCEDIVTVKEYYCEEGEAKATLIACPDGFKCVGGKCIKGRIECTDSDGGNNIYEEGTVIIESLIKGTYIDKCTSATRLKEYYCEDDELVVYEVECASGCLKARCLK